MARPNVASQPPRSTWRGARRLPVGVALIVLCIFGMVALPYWSSGRSEELRGELRETLGPLEISLERARRGVVEIANDARGYWLTGDRDLVSNLPAADAAVRTEFNRARELAARSDRALLRDIEEAEHAYSRWGARVRPAIGPGDAAGSPGVPQGLVAESNDLLSAFTVQVERALTRVRAREASLRDRSAEFARLERAVILVLGTLASIVVAYLTWLAVALLRAQRRALEERDQLETVLASVDSGILLLDRDLRVAIANERAAELLEVPLFELVGAEQRRLIHERLLPRLAEARAFERRIAYINENPEAIVEDLVHVVRPEPRTLSRYGSPVRDESGALLGRVEVYRDVTEALRRERELAEANERKDRFVATLSHELRTPLTPILGWIELLWKERDPRRLEHGLEAIRRNVELEAQLVEDLLDLSKVVNQKLELDFQPVDVVESVEAAVDTVRHLAEDKGVKLEVRLPSSPAVVWADDTRFIQIVWNLLSNAIKFTPAGRRIGLEAEVADERLRVVVEDEGEGIEPGFLPHIFKPFEQGHERQRQRGGLGVGLALARSLVELHGGEIVAESDGLGRGARFTFWLPRERPGQTAVARPAHESAAAGRRFPRRWFRLPSGTAAAGAAAAPRMPEAAGDGAGGALTDRRRILVVEDNPDTLEAMRILLESWGYEVRAVDNARAAIASLREAAPDVVISDIGMPDVDGLAVAAEAQRMRGEGGSDVLLIAITGFASKADREGAMAAGFDAYLTKPINFAALRSLLERNVPPRLEPQRA